MMNISRRSFLELSSASLAVSAFSSCAHIASEGKGTGLPFPSYRDAITGARVYMVTDDGYKDQTIYQTHPQWTPGMRELIIYSDRSGGFRPHAVNMASGAIDPIAPEGLGHFGMARKTGRTYYSVGRQIVASSVGQPEAASTVAELPSEYREFSGVGFSLDAAETSLYFGVVLEPGLRWAVVTLDLASGGWRVVTDLDFTIGHVQAHPSRSDLILFCQESGGDTAQRTWLVQADGSGLRPFYKETYGEWVTHETWWGEERALFTIWPYDPAHEKLPHGVVSVDLNGGDVVVHAQYPAWHTAGCADGRWVLGDDFDRNIWLIDAQTNERRLLTQGHRTEGINIHPHASFSPDGRYIVTSSSRNGHEDVFLVEIPGFESLPRA